MWKCMGRYEKVGGPRGRIYGGSLLMFQQLSFHRPCPHLPTPSHTALPTTCFFPPLIDQSQRRVDGGEGEGDSGQTEDCRGQGRRRRLLRALSPRLLPRHRVLRALSPRGRRCRSCRLRLKCRRRRRVLRSQQQEILLLIREPGGCQLPLCMPQRRTLVTACY